MLIASRYNGSIAWGFALCFLYMASPALGAGPKSGGGFALTDDLTVGTGRADSTGGTFSLGGALGQFAVGRGSAGGLSSASGFYGHGVSSPAALAFGPVHMSSASLSWGEPAAQANPAGTMYTVEVSTASDFSGTIVSSETFVLVSTITGLNPGTTYYARVRASHMNGDQSPFTGTILAKTYGWSSYWASAETDQTANVAWGDYDNDGDLDFAVGNITGQVNRVYRNDGGTFVLAWNSVETDDTVRLDWGDYDNDGDLDLAAGNANGGNNRIYRNDGTGSFVSVWNSTEGDDTLSVAWGDYDNDGDLDLAVGNNGPNRVYRNDGAGAFTLVWNSAESEVTGDFVWGDYDGDGDLDLAAGNVGPSNRVYRNDGSGTFTLVWNSLETDETMRIAWGDYDNDGYPDLAVANGNASGQPNRVYRNEGGTGFSLAWSSQEAVETISVAWGDYDNDGYIDLAVGNGSDAPDRVYHNDAAGGFASVWTSAEALKTREVVWADFDGDGTLDLAAGYYSSPNRVYRGDFAFTNTAPTAPTGLAASFNYGASLSTAIFKWDGGDYDLHGDSDTVYYQVAAASVPMILATDGSLFPSSTSAEGFALTWTGGSPLLGNYLRPAYKVWPGDFTPKHGVVLSTEPNTESARLLLNTTYYFSVRAIDGGLAQSPWPAQAQFSTLAQPVLGTSVFARFETSVTVNWSALPVSPAHLSSEGYALQASTAPDFSGTVSSVTTPSAAVNSLTVTNLLRGTAYFFRVGSFNWQSSLNFAAAVSTTTFGWGSVWTSAETDQTYAFDWGDYDNDGDLDLLAGNDNNGRTNYVYRNDGGGSFVPAWNTTESDRTLGAAWGDYDNDGDLDFATGNFSAPNRVYRNNGDGTFTLAWNSPESDLTWRVAWGDFDNDGYLDLASANSNNTVNRVHRNNGDGTFSSVWTSAEADDSINVSWADYDRDGYLDMAVSNYTQTDRVYKNNGDGTFTVVWNTPGIEKGVATAWGDYDGDGLLDLAVANEGENDRVYRNGGGGSFTAVWNSAETDSNYAIAWGDYDNDGRPDIFNGRVYRNDGGGGFSLVWDDPSSLSPRGLAVGDFNGDGFLDFSAGMYGPANRVFQGIFASANSPPTAPGGLSASFVYGASLSTATFKWDASDYDTQSDTDTVSYALVATTSPMTLSSDLKRITDPSSASAVGFAFTWAEGSPLLGKYLRPAYKLWPGDLAPKHGVDLSAGPNLPGSALVLNTTYYFRVQTIDNGLARSSWSNEAALATLADVVKSPQVYARHETSVTVNWTEMPASPQHLSAEGYWLEASTSNFMGGTIFVASTTDIAQSTLTVSGLGLGTSYWFRVASINLAGEANFAAAGSTMTYGWVSAWSGGGTMNSEFVTWGDYDNDGDLDFSSSESTSFDNGVWRNDGGATFSLVWNAPDGDQTEASAWGDFDNDGDLDLVTGNNGNENRVYSNNGNGTFSFVWNSVEMEATRSIAWGDYDNDGDLDILAGNQGQESRVYRNDGGGTFAMAWNTPTFQSTLGVAWGDYDNDGYLDFATANSGQENYLYRNMGNGTFTEVWNSASVADFEATRGVAWGDYDNDGDLDLAVGNELQTNRVYRNNGDNTFTSVWNSDETDSTLQVEWGDYDNDGDLDLAVANAGSGEANRVYRNDGGAFTLIWSSVEKEQTYNLAWGDYDNDGVLDLLASNRGTANRLYRGDFGFTNPAPSAPTGLDGTFGGNEFTFKWSAGDYDAQGDSDTVRYALAVSRAGMSLSPDGSRIVNPSSASAVRFEVGWTEGSPLMGKHLRPAYKTWPGGASPKHGLTLAKPGLVANTTYFYRVQAIDGGLRRGPWSAQEGISTLANVVGGVSVDSRVDGGAKITWTPLPAAPQESTSEGYVLEASSTAFNGTGTVYSSATASNPASDLTVTGLEMGKLYDFRVGSLNWSGSANYSTTVSTRTFGWVSQWNSFELDETLETAWGDYDNDGDLDILAGNFNQPMRVYSNNGGGSWTEVWNSIELERPYGAAWGDFDNDGDLDIATAINQPLGSNRVYRNEGNGSFTPVWNSLEEEDGTSVAWGDFDNDGFLDLAVGNHGQTNRVYRNQGDGTFASVWNSVETDQTRSVAWGDFDNDGRLDLAVANGESVNEVNRVYRNAGDGTFVLAWNSPEAETSQSVAWGDFDADGFLDLAVGNYNSQTNRVYRNTGGGSFASFWNSDELENTMSVAWGDFDGDGDLDLAVGNDGIILDEPNRVYRNDGAAFSLVWTSEESEQTRTFAWGDFNNDGRLDLLAGNANNQANRVYRGDFLSANAAPSAPGGLSASFEGGVFVSTLTLKWDGSDYDVQGDSDTVYYAVALATVPTTLSADLKRITDPSSASASGFALSWVEGSPLLGKPLRPAYKTWPADANPKHGVFIAAAPNLAAGFLKTEKLYYYRVQAIDGGLARSSWSAEGTFTTPKLCAARQSAQSGNWSDPNTWAGPGENIPNDCSEVTIASGHTVTVDILTAAASTTTVNGTLKFGRGIASSMTVVGGDISVALGGHIDMGTAADPLTAASTAHLVLAYGGSAAQFGLLLNADSKFTVYGASKSAWTKVVDDFLANGQSVFTAEAADVRGWNIGDTLLLSPTQGSGVNSVSTHTIVGIVPVATQRQVILDRGINGFRDDTATSPVIVANITRNVLVRSSGTDTAANTAYLRDVSAGAGDVYLYNGEFAYLGADVADSLGVEIRTGAAPVTVSSSVFRSGFRGLQVEAGTSTVTGSVFYDNREYGAALSAGSDASSLYDCVSSSNAVDGFLLIQSAGNAVTGNYSFSNAGGGIRVWTSAVNNTFSGNFTFSNAGIGLDVTGSEGNTIEKGFSYANGGEGIKLTTANKTLVDGNEVRDNVSHGVWLLSGGDNTISDNLAEGNLNGFILSGNQYHTFSSNTARGNGKGFWISDPLSFLIGNTAEGNTDGFYLDDGGSDTLLIDNYSHGNSGYGLWAGNVTTTTFVGGALGYRRDGSADPDGTGEAITANAALSPTDITLKYVRVNPAPGISALGFNQDDHWLLSYGQSYATGTVQIHGNFVVSGSTLEVQNTLDLYSSYATLPSLKRGTGHTFQVCSTNDAQAVSQQIVIEYEGTSWKVRGSSTGPMGVISSGGACPGGSDKGQFVAVLNQAAPAQGDRLDFALVAASKDAGYQKKVEFGPAWSAYNNSHSKLQISTGAGIRLVGAPGTPVLMDMLGGSTNYTFVTSGAITAQYATFSNMDSEGLHIGGPAYVAISSSTFDYMGFITGTNTYITALDLNSTVTLDSVTFGVSITTQSQAAYNVRVEGSGANLSWTFTAAGGALAGDLYDDDSNRKVAWFDCNPVASFTDGLWSAGATWAGGFVPTGCNQVDITAGTKVTVDAMNARSGPLAIWGTLEASRVQSSSLTITGGNVNVRETGQLDYGTESSVIPAGITAHFVLALGASAGQYGMQVWNGGDFTVRGATKTPYAFATQSYLGGETAVHVPLADSSGWKAGDRVAVGRTDGSGPGLTEDFSIAALSGTDPNVVTLSGSLVAVRTRTSTTPIVVANLTRNVLIRSSGTNVSGDSAYLNNLVRNTTSFDVRYGEFAYLGAAGAGKEGVYFNGTGVQGGISSATVRDGWYGINVNFGGTHVFERNILYKNAWEGFYATGMSGSTFAYNASFENSFGGIKLAGGGDDTLRGNLTFANASHAVHLDLGTGHRVAQNYAFSSAQNGIHFSGVKRASVTFNNAYANGGDGIKISNASEDANNSDFIGNNSFNNSGTGIYLQKSSSNTLVSNEVYSNTVRGIQLEDSNYNYLQSNAVYSNSSIGIYLVTSDNNTALYNNSYGNTGALGDGLRTTSSNSNTFFGNSLYDNQQAGIHMDASSGEVLVGNYSFNNSGGSGFGLHLNNSSTILLADGALGFDNNGSAAANGVSEIVFDAGGSSEFLEMRGVRVQESGISLAGLNQAGNFIVSYNQNKDTGTLRFWGDSTINDSFQMDYATDLQASSGTALARLRGPVQPFVICGFSETNAVSQVVTLTHDGTNWNVWGSSSGVMGQNPPVTTCSGTPNYPAVSPQVEIIRTGAGSAAASGDRYAFAMLAASKDAGFQKKFLFGNSAGGFNQGRSKLAVDPGATLIFKGVDGFPTIVDRLNNSSTYYSLVSSGSFTASHASFTNIDENGLWLTGTPATLVITSATFDNIGRVGNGAASYITMNDLTAAKTFYNVGFGVAGSTLGMSAAYNVRVLNNDAGLGITFRRHAGEMTGPSYESDTNGKITWQDVMPSSPTNPGGTPTGSPRELEFQWDSSFIDGPAVGLHTGSKVYLQHTDDLGGVVWSTANAQIVSSTGPVAPGLRVGKRISGLTGGVDIYFRVWSQDETGRVSNPSEIAFAFSPAFGFEPLFSGNGDADGLDMAADANGDLHLVFHKNAGNIDVMYAKRSGGLWSPAVKLGDAAAGISALPAVAVDVRGNPHVVWSESGVKTSYSSSTDGGNTFGLVTQIHNDDSHHDIAIDGLGRPHIVYTDQAAVALKYVRLQDGALTPPETVAAGGIITGSYNSLALDGAGVPHVIYTDDATNSLLYSSRSLAGFNPATTLYTDSGITANTDLALDGEGRPRVAVSVTDAGALLYIAYDGASWLAPVTIDAQGSPGTLGLTLDGGGKTHIAYMVQGTNDLKYARWTGTVWSTMTVESAGAVGRRPAIALDLAANVNIAYTNVGLADEVHFASWTGTGFAPPMGGSPRGKAQAPDGFGAIVVHETSATWNWSDNASNELGYRVYASSYGRVGSDFYLAASTSILPAASASWEALGLTPNTTYLHYAAAVNAGGVATSSGTRINTRAVPPVSNASLNEIGETSATIHWGTGSNPSYTEYYAERATDFNFSANLADSGWVVASSFNFTTLSVNTTYYFRAKARNLDAAETGFTVIETTPTHAVRPVTTGGDFSLVHISSLTVTFNTQTNPAGTRYLVELATSNPPTTLVGFQVIEPAGAPSVVFTGLTGNTTYELFVSAFNHAGIKADPGSGGNLSKAITLVTPPSEVFIDYLTSTTIVASAYAPTPAFNNLDKARSATAIENLGGGFNNWRGSTWSVRAGIGLGARRGMKAAHVGGVIYLIGGRTSASAQLNLNEIYNPNADVWTTGAVMPTARREYALAVLHDRVYVIGGRDSGGFKTETESYDPDTDSWDSSLRAMPSSRSGLELGVSSVAFYAIGGYQGALPLGTNDEYDVAADVWTTGKASLPNTRQNAVSISTFGKVYVIGGSNGPGTAFYDFVEAYDPLLNNWSAPLTSMPSPRAGASAGAIGGKIYVIGGQAAGGVFHAVNEEYDPRTDTWSERVPMITTRSFSGVAVSSGIMYIFGGTPEGTSDLAAVEAFDPGVSHVLSNLGPNSFNQLAAKSRNSEGVESSPSAILNVYTLAALPAQAGTTYLNANISSVTLQWTANGNPSGPTGYRTRASTAPDFSGDLFRSDWTTAVSTAIYGLGSNTTYYFSVQARNGDQVETSFVAIGSTATAANVPSSPSLTPVERSSITFNWNAGGNVPGTDYVAEISLFENFSSVLASSLTKNNSAIFGFGGQGPSLSADTTHWFRVKGLSFSGQETVYTSTLAASTLVEVPTASGLPFPAVTIDSIQYEWQDLVNNPGTLYEAQVSTDDFTTVNLTSATFSTYTVVGSAGVGNPLLRNATHYFRVRAKNSGGSPTAYAGTEVKVTLAALPLAPSPELSTVDLTSVTYVWDANGNQTGTLYQVELTSNGFNSIYVSSLTRSTSVLFGTGGTGTALAQNTTYEFRVTPINHEGVAAADLTTSTNTRAAEPVFAPFSSVEVGSITVNWTANNNPPGTKYYVIASTDGFTTNNFVSSTTALTLQAGAGGIGVSLDANTTYSFTLRAEDVAGTLTSFPAPVSTATLAGVPQSPAIGVVGVSSVSASWGGANPGGTLFEAQISTDGFATVNFTSATYNPSAVFNDLSPGTTHYVRMRAVNFNGIPSPFVAALTTATLAAPPASAVSTFTAVYLTSMTVTWDVNGNGSGVSYDAVLSTGILGSAGDVPVSTRAASADISGLTANTTYTLYVRAVNAGGFKTPYTVMGSTPTLPFQPTLVAAPFPGVFVTSAVFSWGDNSNASGTVYAAVLSTSSTYPNDFAGNKSVSTAPIGGEPTATLTGLVSNATYFIHVAAIGHSGAATPFTLAGSTATRPAQPATAVSTFSDVTGVSLTGGWDANGNSAGTRYEAVLSTGNGVPSGFAGDIALSTEPEADPSADFTGLTPNTTYFLIARTVARDGTLSPYTVLGSTLTPVAPPTALALAFSSGSSTGLVGQWDTSNNPPGTRYDVYVTTHAELEEGHAGNVFVSTQPAGAASAEFTNLLTNVTYYMFGRSVDRSSRTTPYVLLGASATLAALPDLAVQISTPFAQVDFNAVYFEWSANGNSTNTVYEVQIATNNFTQPTVNVTSVTFSTRASFGNLGAGPDLTFSTTYYLRVRALSVRGAYTPYTAVQSTVTLSDDFHPPTIVNNQTGDGVWRNASGLYNLDVFDTGGRKLDRIEVTASTVPAGVGPDLFTFTPVVTALSAFGNEYTTDWSLEPVFDLLTGDTTNYVTVRVFDGNNNNTTLVDAFYVLKDTTPPNLINAVAPGDDTPRTVTGTPYNVDVVDSGSGLVGFQYSASTAAASGDQGLVSWTDIASLPYGAAEYTTDWALASGDFAALIDGTTNYVSLRAWDVAGTTVTSIDAFHVIKDTSGPIVVITVPNTAFRSVLTTLSGTAYDIIGVQGTEVNIRKAAGNWWNGGSFAGGSEVWLPVTGSAAWEFSPGITWVEGQAYQIVARSSDSAGNYSANYATATFTLDTTTPTVAVGTPVPDSTISTLASITGTANDPGAAPAGLLAVGVRIQNLADGLWWDFFNEVWKSSGVTQVASGLGTWSLTPSELLKANLKDQTSYFIAAQVSDNAVPTNESDFRVGGATFTFSDTTAPSGITNLTGVTGVDPGDISLSWTASGDDGDDGTTLLGEFRIHYSTDAGVSFSTDSAQVVISTSLVAAGSQHGYLLVGLSTATPLLADSTYYIRIFQQDDAGNWSALSNLAQALSAPAPFELISGHVVTASSQGITAVSIVAYGSGDVLISTTVTVADGSGTYHLAGILPGDYKVEATYEVNEIISSVWIDGIQSGASLIDFVLEINYTLSTVQGNLTGLSSGLASAGFGPAAAATQFKTSRVELLQRGGVVAAAGVGEGGNWKIANLLPGKYSVRAFNGLEYTKTKDIYLLEGEIQDVQFVYDPLNEETVFAFPNPAEDRTTIRFFSALLPLEAQIRIFDISGTLVREIIGQQMSSPKAGLYHAEWDLKNNNGEDVASGVYMFIVKVKGGNGQSAKVIKKLAVVR